MKGIDNLLRRSIKALKPYSVESQNCRVRLNANENPYDLPSAVKEEIFSRLTEHSFNRYPDPAAKALRERIASTLGVDLASIAVGNGSDELVENLILSFGKEETIVTEPTFTIYSILSTLCGVKCESVTLKENFELDAKSVLERARSKGSSLIFIGYPNNPTGNCFSPTRVEEVIKNSGAIVVVDEAYYEFSERSFLPLLKKYENLVILRSFSKAFGLAGLRIGYLVASPSVVEVLFKVKLPFNLNVLSQIAASVALECRDELLARVKTIVSERERVFKELENMDGVSPFPSEANFVLFRVEKGTATSSFNALVERGILIRNFAQNECLKDCLRVTVGTPTENDSFLKALKQIV